MSVVDLIGRPCGWSPDSPKKLRRELFPGCTTWNDYSTSGHLRRQSPTLSVHSDRVRFSSCPNLIVEILSGEIANLWQGVGLRFAADIQLTETMFVDRLVEALLLIRSYDAIHGTVTSLCRCLHPLICSDDEVDISFSDPQVPLSIFVSCPSVQAVHAVERLAESIIHEALHLQLSLVERVEPLVEESASQLLVHSPWKGEDRTVQGVLHGAYVFGNLLVFWTWVAEKRPDSAEFAKARVRTIEAEMRDVSHLVRCQRLTGAGRRLVSLYLGKYSFDAGYGWL